MKQDKQAFFTIDAESFYNTECIEKLNVNKNESMLDGLDEYLSILEKHGIRATLFFLVDTALSIKDKVSEYVARGHKLALHGLTHTPPLDMDEESFFSTVKSAKETLENQFSQQIIGYRAPFFSLDDKRLNVIKQLGFSYDASKSTCVKARHSGQIDLTGYTKILDGAYEKDNFFEFPLVCKNLFGITMPISGGGYARFIPWGFFKTVLKSHLKKSDYYTFYLHPFELSKKKIPSFKGLKPYDKSYLSFGRKTFNIRIEKIINLLKKNGFSFNTMEDFVLSHNNI